jgi:hypothetical protein
MAGARVSVLWRKFERERKREYGARVSEAARGFL